MAEMSPLRRRMTEDMTVRNLSPATQRCYLLARQPRRRPRRLAVDQPGGTVRVEPVHPVPQRLDASKNPWVKAAWRDSVGL